MLRSVAVTVLALAISFCASRDVDPAARASEFRQLLEEGRLDEAQSMLSSDARRWWGSRQGKGAPWRVDREPGPWAGWDEHFRSQKEAVEWRATESTATVIIRETNDYFALLERGWVTSEITYFFDRTGKIEGLLIRAVGDRPMGRTAEFLEWAEKNASEEIGELMPAGEIDPRGDHPERFRTLLERWRREAGLAPVFDDREDS